MGKPGISALILFAFLGILMLPSCLSVEEARPLPDDAVLGTIETRGTAETSRIAFYDADMNEVAYLSLRYATLGGIFYDPLVYEGDLYAIPQGRANRKDGNAALQLHLESLETVEYAIEQPAMNAIAANDTCVYTCNTLNGVSYINRCQKESGEVTDVALPEVHVTNLLWHGDALYAFGAAFDGSTATIFRYDDDLSLQGTMDISEYGGSVYKAISYDDVIYFCTMDDPGDGKPGRIGVLDGVVDEVNCLQLGKSLPLSMALANDKLYITHYNIVQGQQGSDVSIVDLKTGAIAEHVLEHAAQQMVIRDGSMYVLGDWAIYRYDLEDLHLVGKTDVNRMGGDYSYLTGLFAFEPSGVAVAPPAKLRLTYRRSSVAITGERIQVASPPSLRMVLYLSLLV